MLVVAQAGDTDLVIETTNQFESIRRTNTRTRDASTNDILRHTQIYVYFAVNSASNLESPRISIRTSPIHAPHKRRLGGMTDDSLRWVQSNMTYE